MLEAVIHDERLCVVFCPVVPPCLKFQLALAMFTKVNLRANSLDASVSTVHSSA
jgi:hypothetical protein